MFEKIIEFVTVSNLFKGCQILSRKCWIVLNSVCLSYKEYIKKALKKKIICAINMCLIVIISMFKFTFFCSFYFNNTKPVLNSISKKYCGNRQIFLKFLYHFKAPLGEVKGFKSHSFTRSIRLKSLWFICYLLQLKANHYCILVY